jgi:hypothetical protein
MFEVIMVEGSKSPKGEGLHERRAEPWVIKFIYVLASLPTGLVEKGRGAGGGTNWCVIKGMVERNQLTVVKFPIW